MKRAFRQFAFAVIAAAPTCGALAENQPRDPISFAESSVIEISDVAKIPAQLARAIEAERGCELSDTESGRARVILPVTLFLSASGHAFAFTHCRAGVVSAYRLYEFRGGLGRDADRVYLPVMAPRSGFLVSDGGSSWLTLDAATMNLTVRSASDLCPTPVLRHLYRFEPAESAFALYRIEIGPSDCGEPSTTAWTTVWEAPAWPDLRSLAR